MYELVAFVFCFVLLSLYIHTRIIWDCNLHTHILCAGRDSTRREGQMKFAVNEESK